MTKSTIILKRTSNVDLSVVQKENLEKQIQKENISSQPLYFLECLKRKNSITTEFYINIHTSILTFKQFFKVAQQCKPRLPDPSMPRQQDPSKNLFY